MAAPSVAGDAGKRIRVERVRTVLVAALCAEYAYALLARGAFFSPASTIVLAASLLLLGIAYSLGGAGRVSGVEIALLGLALWWLLVAHLHGVASSFEPLGASVVSVVAGAAIFRIATPGSRRLGVTLVTTIAAVFAVTGIVACDVRWYPIAMRAQDLWRLSGPVNYSNAAGLLLAMSLLLAVDRTTSTRASPVVIAACVAGLLATQSRAAVLGAVVALVWLSRDALTRCWLPMLAGALAGVITVASSSGHSQRPVALVVTLLVLAGVAVAPSSANLRRMPRAVGVAILVVLGIVIVLTVVVAAHRELVRRIDAGSDLGRLREWRAALGQFASSVWTGVGPDQPLTISARTGTTAYFAHNEYLQVLAGGGLVAAALLCGAVASGIHRIRNSAGLCGARAALVVALIGGVFDFTWHVPAIGLLIGLSVGLASPDPLGETKPDHSPRPHSWRPPRLASEPRRTGPRRVPGTWTSAHVPRQAPSA